LNYRLPWRSSGKRDQQKAERIEICRHVVAFIINGREVLTVSFHVIVRFGVNPTASART
jgi:hypothetical protein